MCKTDFGDVVKKIKLHPLFVLYIFFLIIIKQYESISVYLFVVFLHEFGHYIVAKKLGYKVDKMMLMPYGVCLNYNTNFFSFSDEILIAISGPFVNFMLTTICFAMWWVFPIVMQYTQLFCYCNFILFFFNLLPCYPLDGGRVLCGIIAKKYDRKTALKIVLILNIGISVVLFLTFIIGIFFKVINTNLAIISMFLFVGILEPKKSTSYNYLTVNINRKNVLNKAKEIKFTLVKSGERLYKIIAKMSKFKFNIFYVIFPDEKIKILTELALEKLALKYSPLSTLDEIFT